MFWWLAARICLAFLSLRYRVEVKGLASLTPERLCRKGGVLFLPNHTSHIEPILLFIYLWPKFRMQPIVVEYIFRQKILRPWMRLVKGLPIPNFDTSINQFKIRKAQRAIEEVARGLKEGRNFLMYPSGRLKTSGRETVGGASGAHGLLQECPDANIVLIRTTGLWGSMFSRALEGRSPDIRSTFVRAIKILFRNALFFTPRRKILIEIEPASDDFPRSAPRIEFNRALEEWYNQYLTEGGAREGIEPLNLVSYSRFRVELPEPHQADRRKSEAGDVVISEEIRERIFGEVRKILDKPQLELNDEMHLATDLGMDSLNIAELMTFLSKKWEIEEVHPEDLETVRSALEIAAGAQSGREVRRQPSRAGWPAERLRPDPIPPVGKTFPEAFLLSCQRMRGFTACADDLVGVLTYRQMRRAALVLAQSFRTLKGKYVAVLLPASVGAHLTILALQLAGKVPVMLNWTLGPRYLEEMMRISGAEQIISSWRFLDRLSHVEFGNLVDQILLLEDIRQELSLKMKLQGVLLSLRSPQAILSSFHLDTLHEDEPAVILFTSGTEASPKGVPLSHKNILSNLRSGMHCIELSHNDVVYGVLPPFHSFGFSVAGLFSVLTGMRIAFYPDPTDAFALAEGIDRFKITIFCSTPSFLRGLIHAAKPQELASIRYFIAGAEKTPQELYDRVRELGTGAKIMEGYGITECSPILTINRPNMPPKGVGHPLADVEVCMIHPETLELLPEGSEGEICVRGPNVFRGYLESPRNPFIEIEGKSWYRTGDLGRLEDGALILSGRLKRFIKVGGEMISLGAIEGTIASALVQRGKISAETSAIALCADEREEGKPRLILFAVVDLDVEEANDILQASGFSRIAKISVVRKVEAIPLMGTGKTDYRTLQSQL